MDTPVDPNNDPGRARAVNALKGRHDPDPLRGSRSKWLLSRNLDKGDGAMLKRVPLLVKRWLGEDEALAIGHTAFTCTEGKLNCNFCRLTGCVFALALLGSLVAALLTPCLICASRMSLLLVQQAPAMKSQALA